MASTLMLDDRLQIDGFNPTTWTGDFGINKDGFRKDLFMDGSYTTGIDETPMQMNDVIPVMNSTDLAGNTYLKTAAPSVAPYGTFPARKFEYSNGCITWRRPQLPWSWETGKSVGGVGATKDIKIILILLIAVILFYFFGRMKMK
jgi:hypothetical protein